MNVNIAKLIVINLHFPALIFFDCLGSLAICIFKEQTLALEPMYVSFKIN